MIYLSALNSIFKIMIFSSCYILANLFISSILNESQGNTTSQDDTKDDHGQLLDWRQYRKAAVLDGRELRKSCL